MTVARFGVIADSVITRDINDNDTETIVVGDSTQVRQVVVEYSLELPISDKAQGGEIVIIQDSSGVGISHEYSFEPPEFNSVVFTADISGTDIRLLIQCIGLGENPVFKYRLKTIPVA